MVRALFLVWITVVSAPAGASVLPAVPPPREATSLDSLRADAKEARLSGDPARCRKLIQEILTRNPGDGFALREAVTLAHEQEDEPIEAKLAPGGSGIVRGVSISRTDLAFQQALVAYYHERYRTALEIVTEVNRQRPGWGWGLYYEARIRQMLIRPRAEIDSVYREAMADPDVAGAVFYSVLRNETARRNGIPPPEAPAFIAWMRRNPWQRILAEQLAVDRVLRARPLGRSDLETAWQDARGRLGDLVGDLAIGFGYAAYSVLPLSEADEFVADREREGLALHDWRLVRARFLVYSGAERKALAALESTARGDPLHLRLALLKAIDVGRRTEVMKLAERLQATSGDPYDIAVATRAYRTYGDSTRADTLWQQVVRENPGAAIRDRIDAAMPGDPRGLVALLDSLDIEGSDIETASDRLALREALGDSVATAELDSWPADRIRGLVSQIADAALLNGDTERAKRLWVYADERTGGEWTALILQTNAAASVADTAFSLATARRTLRRAAGHAWAVSVSLRTLAAHGQHAEAIEYLSRLVRERPRDFDLCVGLTYSAMQLQRPDLADTLLTLAAELEPRSRTVREMRAWYLFDEGPRDEARRVLEELLREQPGREGVRQFLARLEGTPTEPEPSAEPDAGSVFQSDEYESTDWIRARMAAADTIRNAPVVLLAIRNTLIGNTAESYQVRRRTTILVKGAEGIKAARVITLPFRAGQGTPRVLVARVIQPDGTVLNVKPSEMVVTANQDERSDVTDARVLVIPMPGLTIGSVVDVASVTNHHSDFSSGWSWSATFSQLAPALESTIEVQARRGLPLTIHPRGRTPAPTVTEEESRVITRWTAAYPSRLEPEDYMSDWQSGFAWIDVGTIGSWGTAVDLYRKPFWKQVEVTGDVRALAKRVTDNARTPGEKLDSLLAHVGRTVNYTAIEFGKGRVIPTPAKEVLKRGYADCKGMVGLLIALCEAVGLEAWPVLVSVNGSIIQADFVSLGVFDHMIVYLPSIDGGRFCDPTARPRCALDLPASVAGRTGLTFGRTGPGRLIEVTPASPRDHGLSMTIDLRPVTTANEALIEIRGRFRGDAARTIEALLQATDSSVAQAVVDLVLGRGLPDTVRREGWSLESRDCQSLTLRATYRDTTWSYGGNEVVFTLPTRAATCLLGIPAAQDRRYGVRLEHPFADTVLVRLHAGAEWEPSRDIAELQVHGAAHAGAYRSRRVGNDADHWVEIRQEFEILSPEFTVEAYEEFHRDWMLYTAALGQPYRYRRRIDAEQLKRLQAYAESHPEDLAFAVEAATKLLGDDVGGTGAEGKTRRATARLLLRPHIDRTDREIQPRILMATMEMKEGRYRAADSILSAARRLDRNNLDAMYLQSYLFDELGAHTRRLVVLEELQQKVGDESVLLWYIALLYQMGRDEDARQAEERYTLLAGGVDQAQLDVARWIGLMAGLRCREAEERFAALQAPDSMWYRMMEIEMKVECGSLHRAAELVEDLLKENPFNAAYSNEAAWIYARLGENLDRAQALAETAALLDPEDLEYRNTQAAVAWRAGKIAEARALLESMEGRDDRPKMECYNGYIRGQCDWAEGRKDEAVLRWKKILPWADERLALMVKKSLDLAASGGEPGEGFGE